MKPRDLDLGDGHWLDWSTYKGKRCGGVIYHTSDKTESGICSGAFWISDEYHKDCGRTGPVWSLSGTFEGPTLSPSFLCHCGDHGFVRDGKWVRA
jgi:hypothetical protein